MMIKEFGTRKYGIGLKKRFKPKKESTRLALGTEATEIDEC